MRPSAPLAVALATASLVVAAAAERKGPSEWHPWPVPEGVRVTLLLDKWEHFLGENILVHYCVENVGAEPFRLNMGADHRGSIRRTRFKVAATDEAGKPVPDPEPPGRIAYSGGPQWTPTLEPGDQFHAAVPLIDYLRFEKPGVYTIRVFHDLGWKETNDRKIPIAKADLRLVMPTEAEARDVVEQMYELADNWPGIFAERRGERAAPYGDFSALRYPVYLPILLEKARKGCEYALEGITYIATPAASKALVELLDHKDPDFALAVARSLEMRLPHPARRDAWFCLSDLRGHREWLARAWRPELAPRVRAYATELLASGESGKLTLGAAMLHGVGEADDLPVLVRALDRLVPEVGPVKVLVAEQRESRRGVCGYLADAATTLLQRGGKVPLSLRSPGEALVFLAALRSRGGFRPKGWTGICQGLLRHEIAYIREVALKSLPEPLPKAFVKMLPTLLFDPDREVQTWACYAARESKAPELREPLLKLAGSTRDPEALGTAFYAAEGLGARVQALQLVASRLDDPHVGQECLMCLLDHVIEKRGGSYPSRLDVATARELKPRWAKLVQDHREALKAGKRLKVGHPDVTPELLPPGWRIHPEDDKRWP